MIALPWLESGPVALVARASAILIVAFVLHRMLRRSSALSRHALWATVMIGLVALPLLQLRLPRLGIPGWSTTTPPGPLAMELHEQAPLSVALTSGESVVTEPVQSIAEAPPSVAGATDATAGVPWQAILVFAWCLGGAAVLVPVMVGVRRARRLVGEAFPVGNRRMLARLDHLRRVTGVRRPVLLAVSERVRTPMAWGVRRPAVLLPMDAAEWTADRFDAVLVHELVHIRRGDTLHQAIARVATAWYWFHPLVWLASRRAAVVREQACDDAVLQFGTRPSHYARHLMELAEQGTTMTSMPALARLHHPNLEDRIMTILQHVPARRSPWRTALAVATVAAWTITVAAVGPAAAQRPAVVPAAPAAPTLPTPPPAPVRAVASVPTSPNAPLPVRAAPPPPPPLARPDCARGGNNGLVVSSQSSSNGPNRVIHRNLDDGRTICLAIRGALPEDFVLAPLDRLPAGIALTLEASHGATVQRMEITGASAGNQHRWLVNGTERPVDAEAREWRDAMLEVLSRGLKASRVRTAAAIQQTEVMRSQAVRMASEDRARMAVEARDLRDHAVRVNEQAQVLRAQRADIEAASERVHAQAVRLRAERPSEVDEQHVRAMQERAVIQDRRVRDQERVVAEVAERVRRSADEVRVAERAMVDRARVIRDRSDRLAEVANERAVEAAARLREVESPRLRELDAELAPLERRLREIIDRVGP